MGERQSESVRIAEAGLLRARGQVSQAVAQGLPQINASASYQRAIQNQFQELQERSARAAAYLNCPESRACSSRCGAQ